ncbi:restriction endonuclease subunit S [Faecalibacterium prausnitzii]|uniref:restriction endonuclease subunit S n=1 Tax=Faecalibacterium prausnitzii TaxID=853 RepID=UPI001C0151D0|nr:restriction endonuclease subunit S [Faecalibacterium prausnitzii]
MQDNEKKPALRFKGFTDPWEQRKLDEIANFSKGVGYSKNDLCEEGTPIILYGRLYTKYETSIFDVDTFVKEKAGSVYSKGGEVIVPASGETAEDISIASVVVKPGILLGGDLNIVSPTTEYDSAFLALTISSGATHKYLSSLAQGKSVVHLHNADIQSVSAKFPTKREQEKIHLLFGKIDTLITLHQRKYEKLVNIKKSMLDKMFPPNGVSVPEIRFKGFTDPWEQRKLKELYFQLTERNADLLPYQKTLSVATMSFKTDGNGAADTSLANYKRLRTGDIAFEGHTSKEFRYGRFVLNDVGDGIMSPRFSALRPLHEMPINFWKYYIHYEPIMRKVLVNSTKAGTMMNELVINEFLQESILVPSVAEQQAIGRFFKQLDTLITLHQRKLEKLQNIKKSCLEKMFV